MNNYEEEQASYACLFLSALYSNLTPRNKAMMTIEILKKSLTLAEITQQEVAERAEAKPSMVNHVLNGRRNSPKIKKAAQDLLAEKIESDPMAAALVRAFTKEVEG